MINEEQQEKLVERIVERISKMNEEILKVIGERLKFLGQLNASQLHQITQMLMYGEDINKITRIIQRYTGMNINEIYAIFEEEAKINQRFAKQFYLARGLEYTPYRENIELQNLVNAIIKTTVDNYLNISGTLGFAYRDELGKIKFTPLAEAYRNAINDSILALSTGQIDYKRTIKGIVDRMTESGISTIDYASGYHRRLDSAVRMNTMEGLRNLTNELQQQFGEEFNADGVEISVHAHPAPDHAETQGKQFTKKEYENMQNSLPYRDYKGNEYEALKRHIGQWNCYHYIFSIVLGVNKPLYTDKQLKEIEADNKRGFEFEGKHYTKYEGTQLQRRIETEIRKQKEKQILAKSAGDMENVANAQRMISILTSKYKDLSRAGDLPTKLDRMRVTNYRRINVKKF